MSLFGKNGSNGQLVQFKAGRMNKESDSNMVVPDKRKGLIIMKRNPEDGLIHFMWQDREVGTIETDLIIFPDEAIFRHVKECTTGRVYLLEFKISKQMLFFWLQEPSTDNDEEFCKSVNHYLNSPDTSESYIDSSANQMLLRRLLDSGVDASDAEQLLNNVDHADAEYILRVASSCAPQSPPLQSSLNGHSPVSASRLSTAVSGLSASPFSDSSSLSSPASAIPPPVEQKIADIIQNISSTPKHSSSSANLTLNDIVNNKAIISSGILDDDEVLVELQSHLPEGGHDSVRSTLVSSQFKLAVDVLNRALQYGDLSDLLKSFGLKMPSVCGPSKVECFLLAIQEQATEGETKMDQ